MFSQDDEERKLNMDNAAGPANAAAIVVAAQAAPIGAAASPFDLGARVQFDRQQGDDALRQEHYHDDDGESLLTDITVPSDRKEDQEGGHFREIERLRREIADLRLRNAGLEQERQRSDEAVVFITHQAAQVEAARLEAVNARMAAEEQATVDLAQAARDAQAQAELVRAAAEAARVVAVHEAEAPLRARIAGLEAELVARPAALGLGPVAPAVEAPPKPRLLSGAERRRTSYMKK